MRRIGIALLAGALLVLTAAPSGAVDSGTWRGQTKQNQSITFKVKGGDELTYMKLTVVVSGGGCSVEVTSTNRGLHVPIANDRFKVTVGSGDFQAAVKGTFVSDSSAKGTIVADTSGMCPGHKKTGWTAER
jgi:hypothetical protein